MKKIKFIQEFGVVSLSIAIVFIAVMGVTIAKGWVSAPAGTPPAGNVGAPINTSGIGQTKGGNLVLNQLGAYVTGLTVNKNLEVISGDVCATPSGGVKKCLNDGKPALGSAGREMVGYVNFANSADTHKVLFRGNCFGKPDGLKWVGGASGFAGWVNDGVYMPLIWYTSGTNTCSGYSINSSGNTNYTASIQGEWYGGNGNYGTWNGSVTCSNGVASGSGTYRSTNSAFGNSTSLRTTSRSTTDGTGDAAWTVVKGSC